jgi:methionyl-tRNA formyltransferase
MKIVFFGTPDFAVASLLQLIESGFDVVAVVTSPDKPAGRGLQMKASPVKESALKHGIRILQPDKLKSEQFLAELNAIQADIHVVVAFRMLPEVVWNMPPLGTWNLHASLLPDFRGAAPINHAIIQGDRLTGLTTFKLVHAIDEGAIALQLPVPIKTDDDAGTLHDRMMSLGAGLLATTLRGIQNGNISLIEQNSIHKGLASRHAPKLNAEFSKIDWNQSSSKIYNFVRGLSPYPGATCILNTGIENIALKLYKGRTESYTVAEKVGTVVIDEKSRILVQTANGLYELLELQPAGKRRMDARDFINGLRKHDGLFMV